MPRHNLSSEDRLVLARLRIVAAAESQNSGSMDEPAGNRLPWAKLRGKPQRRLLLSAGEFVGGRKPGPVSPPEINLRPKCTRAVSMFGPAARSGGADRTGRVQRRAAALCGRVNTEKMSEKGA